jgi:hypothetical protein
VKGVERLAALAHAARQERENASAFRPATPRIEAESLARDIDSPLLSHHPLLQQASNQQQAAVGDNSGQSSAILQICNSRRVRQD